MDNCKGCVHGQNYNYIDICSYEKKLKEINDRLEEGELPFEVTCTGFKDKNNLIYEKPKERYEVGDRFLNTKGETLALTLIRNYLDSCKDKFEVWIWGLSNLTTGDFNIIINDVNNCRGLIDGDIQSIIYSHIYENKLRFKHNKL